MPYSNPNLLPDSVGEFEGGTSAWTAGANTTQAVVTTNVAVPGTKALKVTATAGGSITITSPRVLVTAGTEYMLFYLLYLSAARASRVSTMTVTWYNATSGGTSLGTTVSAINLPNASGFQQTSSPSAIGTAPTGALSMAITYTVTGMTAADYVQVDLGYFGKTSPVAGNLLSYGTQSAEVDASGWTFSGGTGTRTWGTVSAGAGYYCLALTSSAAGDVLATTAARYAVTAGTEYRAYSQLIAGVTGTFTGKLSIRWYDGGGALISTSSATPSFTNTTTTVACVVATAPLGAATAELVTGATATAGTQTFYVDEMSLCVAPNSADNLLTYDEYSTESTLPAWTVDGGTATRSYITSSLSDGYYGMCVVPSASAVITATLDRLVPVVPGTTYSVSAVVFRRNPGPGSTNASIRVRVDWYDSAGELFLADNADQFYSYTLASGALQGSPFSETRECPEGASFAKVGVQMAHSGSLVDAYTVDNVTLKESTAEYEVSVDNATGSVSIVINYGPTVPTETVSILRMDESGNSYPVRGYGSDFNRAPYTPGPVLVEDYEAPLGQRVWYAISWYNASNVRTTQLFTQTVNSPVLDSPDYIWFKSPGLPALNTLVMMEAPVKWSRAARSATYDIVGRKNQLHITGRRAGRTSSISVIVEDPAGNAQFDSLLDSGLPALIQAMPGYGIDDNLYVSVGDSDCDPLHSAANVPGWRWTLPISEIDRPVGGVQGSALSTWQDIDDDNADWFAVFDGNSTWADVLTGG
ncbi:hypothetical protein [Streptomyces sp. Isolate_219]|uniref:hypothetical protein n=1 Tax=Streptomyces sp. Isolate_219 TaxID=2950110 RepID=UPI0021C9B222|nr:hypothetical protein [Streptomyces sp. Isolate_219]MCR8576462.1 hypothetical protein [Streptomyces sp. Isolate_219]